MEASVDDEVIIALKVRGRLNDVRCSDGEDSIDISITKLEAIRIVQFLTHCITKEDEK